VRLTGGEGTLPPPVVRPPPELGCWPNPGLLSGAPPGGPPPPSRSPRLLPAAPAASSPGTTAVPLVVGLPPADCPTPSKGSCALYESSFEPPSPSSSASSTSASSPEEAGVATIGSGLEDGASSPFSISAGSATSATARPTATGASRFALR